MDSLNIGIIGSGIAGLSAAWLLSSRHRVTLYEAGAKLGGHANTVDVTTPEGTVAVDTGFIVYNEPNYPNLTAMLSHLGVDSVLTQMSFAVSSDGGAYEYSGTHANGFFGQRRNAARLSHWALLGDISRFFKTAQTRVDCYPGDVTLGAFLSGEGYSSAFIDHHIIPMGAAIWSTPASKMLAFPARSFIDFYANHGMLQFASRPEWHTVTGGSRNYVERLVAEGRFDIVSGCGVQRVVRHPHYVHVVDERGVVRPFDHVVIATHADQALELLEAPDALETEILGSFRYQENTAILHRDPRWMPRRKRLWSSWNYLKSGSGSDAQLCVTYWMNELQRLETKTDLFVTLNPTGEIHPKAVEATFAYDHPVFSVRALAAQYRLWGLQGRRRTWFCGSYFGYGFHEDGLQSGLAVAEELGSVTRPWRVDNPSGRIPAISRRQIGIAE